MYYHLTLIIIRIIWFIYCLVTLFFLLCPLGLASLITWCFYLFLIFLIYIYWILLGFIFDALDIWNLDFPPVNVYATSWIVLFVSVEAHLKFQIVWNRWYIWAPLSKSYDKIVLQFYNMLLPGLVFRVIFSSIKI